MKTFKITPRTEEDFEELAALLEDIDLIGKMEIEEVDKPPFRRLTPQDMAFGIGRPATDEELKDYFERHKERTFIDIDEAFAPLLVEPVKMKSKKVHED